MKQVIVQKFGGSSLATPKHIEKVASIIAATKESGLHPIVIVSAMGDTTDKLLKLAHEVTDSPTKRELDMLLSAGERISMALLSMKLNAMGVPAISFTGSQAGIMTTQNHADAEILEVKPIRVEEELNKNKVVILAGFQGVNPETKEIMTLGRGGSDTSAVAMADYFSAIHCDIYKDVPGLLNCDPKLTSTKPGFISHIDHDTMLTATQLGANILHWKCIEYAKNKNVTIRIKFLDDPTIFTTISDSINPETHPCISVLQIGENLKPDEVELSYILNANLDLNDIKLRIKKLPFNQLKKSVHSVTLLVKKESLDDYIKALLTT